MSDLMTFPETWEEFEQSYGFTDKDEVYTNGSRLIQSFRVKQWLDHMQTAEAVEVVRCKDCKHYKKMKYLQEEICLRTEMMVGEGDYCSKGERRTEESGFRKNDS